MSSRLTLSILSFAQLARQLAAVFSPIPPADPLFCIQPMGSNEDSSGAGQSNASNTFNAQE
jgi:hypothetical protein